MRYLKVFAILIGGVFLHNCASDMDMNSAQLAYDNGDYNTAYSYFIEEANNDNPTAQYNIGMMYVKGQGALQDDIYAHMWLNIAASNGIANAVELEELAANSWANMAIVMRDLTAKTMTTEQLAEAQKLARECVKKNYKGC